MTASTSENGLRARLHRLARGAVVAAAVMGLSATGGVAPAVADTSGDESTVELHLSAGMRGTVAPGSATTAAVTVQNESASELPAGRATVEIGRTPLGDETSLESWLDDAEAAGPFDEVGSETTTPVDADASATTSIFIPAETLGDLVPGVYPLRATLTGAATADVDDDVVSTSVLVVTPPASAPIAVLVPITATPAGGALLTSDELNLLTAADGALTAVLEGVTGTSAVLAIDPAIPASIRVLGSAAPAPAVEWLRRLDALPNERFALQFGDADLTTQAHAGLPAPLSPTTLAPYLDPSRFSSEATPTPTPTDAVTDPTPEPADGSPALPDDATLVAVDGAIDGIAWPRSDVSGADLDTFSTYLGDDALTILSSSATTGTVGGHSLIGGHRVLVTDAAASGALSRAASQNDAAARQGLLALASAHLFFSGTASSTAPVLVGLSRDDTRSTEALKQTIGSVDTVGFTLSGILAAPAATTTLATEAEAEAARGSDLQRMLADEAVLGDFSTILDDPQDMLSPKRMQIMRATAVGLGAKAFAEAVADVQKATRDTLAAVDIPPASTIQLLSANADLPFSVRNDLPWPVNVRLTVSPSDPRLEVQSVTEATLQPNASTRIKVPVSARVGSGELRLGLQLSSPTGVPISQPESVRVSVRAEWETIGLVLFGALIVLLLGLGTIRTIVRRRRDKRAADAADAVAIEESNE
ncbi:DUF6049 family protein [Microbacterium sp. 1.5R]|uniref:DUF6049 family protein n=1 Tax=Microbacterium sp. 1.5R TaxID=1916917 RepID=UPI00119CE8A3|nr:DUF6049 family protein [Microbacterium sp. 1.5R]